MTATANAGCCRQNTTRYINLRGGSITWTHGQSVLFFLRRRQWWHREGRAFRNFRPGGGQSFTQPKPKNWKTWYLSSFSSSCRISSSTASWGSTTRYVKWTTDLTGDLFSRHLSYFRDNDEATFHPLLGVLLLQKLAIDRRGALILKNPMANFTKSPIDWHALFHLCSGTRFK